MQKKQKIAYIMYAINVNLVLIFLIFFSLYSCLLGMEKGSTLSICSRNSTSNLHDYQDELAPGRHSPRGNRRRLTPITIS